ncbi:MAG: SAM-dependent chlorinase/fluorinase [Bacteroidales bacterium]|nr:SAM-dependent chlorinase/fluorinase [Bacteroidales bacterium]
MKIITLTTDWGADGTYVGAFKGRLLSLLPELTIVDVSHQITPYDIGQAAFTLRGCYKLFPKGTIHVLGVGGEISRKQPTSRNYIAFQKDDYYFIGNDDGIWKLIFEDITEDIYKLPSNKAINEFAAFPELGIYVDAIQKIYAEKPLSTLGKLHEFQILFNPGRAAIHSSMINGEIIHFDTFGNAITNITKEDFERVGKGRSFEIYIGSYHSNYKIVKINNEYCETISGNLLAIFSYAGFLEIAIANGRAIDLLNVKQNKEVRIKFSDK